MMFRFLVFLVLLAGCSAPPGPPEIIWYSDDPEVAALLPAAADLLCEASAGEACPAVGDRGTRRAVLRDLPDACGKAEWHGLWIALSPADNCRVYLPGDDFEVDGAPGRWRMGSLDESRTLILAHELGHTIWGPHHDTRPGALMSTTQWRSVPLILPDLDPMVVP